MGLRTPVTILFLPLCDSQTTLGNVRVLQTSSLSLWRSNGFLSLPTAVSGHRKMVERQLILHARIESFPGKEKVSLLWSGGGGGGGPQCTERWMSTSCKN